MKIVALSGSLGVRVDGVDVARADEGLIGELLALLHEHHVLVFSDQTLTPPQHAAFAAKFGPLSVHPRLKPIAEAREIIEVYDPKDPIAATWHQDQTFLARPPSMTMLVARTLPPSGGDTMFANQQAAFRALSPALADFVTGLRARHRRVGRDASGSSVVSDEALHPVAPRHPATGVRGLFVNRDYTVDIAELAPDESSALLSFLYQHMVRPEFTCRHRWSMGDVVLWDNRSVAHCVVPDATGPRLLHKATMAGDEPK